MDITLDARTAQKAVLAAKQLIRSLENDSNKFRRDVAAATQIPALRQLVAELEEALS